MCTYCMTAEHTTREHEARAKVNAAAMEVRIAALEAELDELRRGAADRAKKESAAKALADSAVLASEYDVKAANRLQARCHALEVALEKADELARWEPLPDSTARQTWLDFLELRAKTRTP